MILDSEKANQDQHLICQIQTYCEKWPRLAQHIKLVKQV